MDQEQNIDNYLKEMSDDEKQHFKMTIMQLITCYGPKANRAVLMMKEGDEMTAITTMNCDEMEAAEMLVEVNNFFGFLNTIDAPPKETFN